MSSGLNALAAPAAQEAGLRALAKLAEPDRAAPLPRSRRRPAPLAAVLAVQAALSLRLMWSNTAFQDEALYLQAGRLELGHAMTGMVIPPYAAYFSGAPVIYPPAGAVAAAIGGLAGARVLSLLFMLGATVLLHGIARRLYGRRAAIFAAALFAGTGSAQFLGAFATYDAMALCLLALALWLGARALGAAGRARVAALALAALVLCLANAAKYASALFDPAVLTIVTLAIWSRDGRRQGLRALAVLGGVLTAGLAGAVALGGREYWHGITSTTLTRQHGIDGPAGVLYLSGEWVGLVLLIAVCGAVAVMYRTRSGPDRALAWALVAAAVLAPAEQARIHTLTSLFKHIGYGALFGSVIAGVALAAFPLALPRARARKALRLSAAVTVLAGVLGYSLAGSHYAEWPGTGRLAAVVTPMLAPGGHYLAEDDAPLALSLDGKAAWSQWTDTWYFHYEIPHTSQLLTGLPAYAAALRAGYFRLVILSFADTTGTDKDIRADLDDSGDYHLAARIPYVTTVFPHGSYRIWELDRGSG